MQFFGINFNVTNPKLFKESLQNIQNSINTPNHFFASDNLIAWNRNLSFLNNQKFLNCLSDNCSTEIEFSILWRTYILCYFAQLATHLAGDFLEIGAYKGNTANIIIDMLDFKKTNKNYYLYDVFEHHETDLNHAMPEHSKELFQKVQKRFQSYPFVHIVKGYVPQSFETAFPQKIAFAHIDLNQAPAELAALNAVLPRLVPGGVIVFDDYGWFAYSDQKEMQDPVLTQWGLSALELPTGQGIVLKPFANCGIMEKNNKQQTTNLEPCYCLF